MSRISERTLEILEEMLPHLQTVAKCLELAYGPGSEDADDGYTMNEFERRILAHATVACRLLGEVRNNTRSTPLQSIVREGYTDSNLGELRRAVQWLVNAVGKWWGDEKNRPQLPRWASAPSEPHRHPGEDATYKKLEARLGMFARIGLQLYRALKCNATGTDSLRIEALNAWEDEFKE